MAISRETTRARYITPANSSIITSERAAGVIRDIDGIMVPAEVTVVGTWPLVGCLVTEIDLDADGREEVAICSSYFQQVFGESFGVLAQLGHRSAFPVSGAQHRAEQE